MHPSNRSVVLRLGIVSMLAVLGSVAHDARGDINIAEDLLVDLRSEDLAPGPVVEWINHGSLGGSFVAVGAPVVEDVAGWENVVSFDGSSYFEGPRASPGIDGANPTRSIEVWAYKVGINGEQTMLHWAHRGGPDGTNMAFNYGNNGSFGAVGHWGGGPDMGWGGAHAPNPAIETWWHLAYTHDGSTTRLYVNGEPAGEENHNLNTFAGDIIRVAAQSDNSGAGVAAQFNFVGSIAQVRIHDGVLTPEQVMENSLTRVRVFENAAGPNPDDAVTEVFRDAVLSWSAGVSAATHNVYLGTVRDEVDAASVDDPRGVLVGNGLTETTHTPDALLDFDQTYYWRVDEVNSAPDFAVFKGAVWSFTVEPFGIPAAGVTATASSFNADNMKPENTVNGSGLNALGQHNTVATDMWLTAPGDVDRWIEFEFDRVYKLDESRIWNQNQAIESFIGFGAKDVTVETSLDRVDWTAVIDVPQFAQGTSTADYVFNTTVDLGGHVAQYLRMTVDAGWGILGQVGLSEVQTLVVPTYPREPQPADGALAESSDVVLGWRLGRDSTSSDVYMGTDPENLEKVGTATEASFDTLSVDPPLGQTQYWQIHEMEGSNVWVGPKWSFTTPDAISVDDFESYADAEFLEIWATWIDGFDDPANGSLVGNGVSGSPEVSIVHAGRQSLPLHFGNGGAQVSEATRTFAQAQDWTRSDAQSLVLYLNRGAGNTGGGQVYVKINDTKIVNEGSGDLPPGWDLWTQWTIDLSAVADAASVRSLTIGVEGAGATGVLYVDSIQLVADAPAAFQPLSWFEAESGALTAPMLVFSDSPTASSGQHIGTLDGVVGDENGAPPADGVATYSFDVPEDGVYRLAIRVIITGGSNSFWFRISGMATNTTNHASGWVRFNDISDGDVWHWDEVQSSDDGNSVVEFTLSAGTHTLEIARREDGTLLDAIAVIQ